MIFLSVRVCNDEMGGILYINCLRVVKFLNYVPFQIKALLIRPVFEAFKRPYDSELISKTKDRFNQHILKSVSMKIFLVIFEKYQLIWWLKLDFRCV